MRTEADSRVAESILVVDDEPQIRRVVDRDLPSDSALRRVSDRLTARASDADLHRMPSDLPARVNVAQGNRPAQTGRELAATRRAGSATGSAAADRRPAAAAPAGVPRNGGRGATTPPPAGGTTRPANPAPANPPAGTGRRP